MIPKPTEEFVAQGTPDIKKIAFGISSNLGTFIHNYRANLYSDPIASVCREISSNCRDSHREAGCTDVPIKISFGDELFNEGEVLVTFEDFGVGISPERAEDIYSKYGVSTKTDTNDQTGCFGLGSKSPFSYCKEFFIVTRFNGIEYEWDAIAPDNEVGDINLKSMEDTDKPNGTQILIPMKESDREKFEKEIFRATGFWDVQPEYVNFKSSFKIDRQVSHGDIEIIENKFQDGDCYYGERDLVRGWNLLNDGIVYPLNLDELKMDFVRTNAPVFVKFNTGELKDLTQNRESVVYTDEVIESIKNKISFFHDYYTAQLESKMNSYSTYWEACIAVEEMKENSGNDTEIPYIKEILDLNNRSSYSYNGEMIETKLSKLSHIHFMLKVDGAKGKHQFKRLETIDDTFKKHPIIFMDTSRFATPRDRTLYDEYEGAYIVMKYDDSKSQLDRFSQMTYHSKKMVSRTVREFLNQHKSLTEKYNFNITNYTSIERAKVERVKSLATEYKNIKCLISGETDSYTYNFNGIAVKSFVDRVELPGKDTIADSPVIDPSTCLLDVVDTIKDVKYYKNRQFTYRMIKKVLGYRIITVAERFSKNFKGFSSVESAMNHPSIEAKIKQMVQENNIDNFRCEDELKTLSKFSFNRMYVNVLLRTYTEFIKRGSYHDIPFTYSDKYQNDALKTLKAGEALVTEIYKEFPLIDKVCSYDSKEMLVEYQNYINLKENAQSLSLN